MQPAQERLVCTCIGAGCGAISAALFTFATFPYDIVFTMSFSGFAGLVGGGFSGAITTNRRCAAIFGAIAGMLLGPIFIRVELHLIVEVGGAGP
jgi:hypothetical protein